MKYYLHYSKTLLVMALLVAITLTVDAQDLKICVIADVHYFDQDLLINDGTAFQTYIAYDRKLIKESDAILKSVVDSLIIEQPDIVIVAGDLTKDGEKTSHEKVAAYFQQIENAGIEVLVTPGNHDINNPHSFSFDGDNTAHVPSVTPDEFAQIYASNGFNQAIETDRASLSYAYNCNDDVTVISMDACKYDNNYDLDKPVTEGEFKPQVLQWIVDRLEAAVAEGRTVLGVMHHGIIEHYTGQETMFSEYVVNNWNSVSTVLADAGMQVVFTGHNHAQDAVLKTTEAGNAMFDIETGSTVTYPCPYRIVELSKNKKLTVKGKRVQKIDYELDDLPFQEYALNFIETGLPKLVIGMLMMEPYYLSQEMAIAFEPAITETFIAHYSGNESEPSAETQGILDVLKGDENYYAMGYTLEAIWNDASPSDWEFEINLSRTAACNEALFNTDLNIFPNPNSGTFSVSGSFENATLKVYDLMGRIQFTAKLSGSQNMFETDLPTGVYMFEIATGNLKFNKRILVK